MTPTADPGTPSSRHPFVIFTLALCVVIGLPLVFGPARPGSISEALPYWAQTLWGIGLGGGSLVALAGVLWRRTATGLLIEQVGLAFTGCACLFYAACALVENGWAAAVAAALVTGFGASCVWRWFQIQALVQKAGREACDAG